MSNWQKILVFLGLILIPVIGRVVWYYRGVYTPPDPKQVEQINVDLPITTYQPFADQPSISEGLIVIDQAHENNLEIDDLNPLEERLAARGGELDVFQGSASELKTTLRGAKALVVLAPSVRFSPEERAIIRDFVNDGGRLLLAADPTRPVPQEEEEVLDLFSIFFPTSAVPIANSLSRTFGVLFFDDYLYNLTENEGNYRNVRFKEMNESHPLTRDVDTAVFFATHSLRGGDRPLFTGDENTLSNLRTGESALSPAVLAGDGNVFALGDLTLLTPPYHTIAGNDHLLSNISDWLISGRRERDLTDFPYLFQGPVDLVQIAGDFFDPQLVVFGGNLQQTFEAADIPLGLRREVTAENEAILVGTFEDTEIIKETLTSMNVVVPITVTTAITGTENGEEVNTEMGTHPIESVSIQGLGTLGFEGTTLFIEYVREEGALVLVLAQDDQGIKDGLDRMAAASFEGCLKHNPTNVEVTFFVCSTGEGGDRFRGGEGEKEAGEEGETEPPPALKGKIFIYSDDDGPEGVRTSATEFEAILSEFYEVTVWSASESGIPSTEDLKDFDAYIVDSGDFAYDEDDEETFLALLEIENSVIFIGAQPFPPFGEVATMTDVEVSDFDHPLAEGFEENQVIELLESESGTPTMVFQSEDFTPLGAGETVSFVLSRGPNSEESGNPVVIANEREDGRFIIAGIAFYRLPEEVQRTLALNIASWLTE